MLEKEWDERRELIVPGDKEETLTFCVEHFIHTAQEAIAQHGSFFVALSGGSTPKAIFERLCHPPYKKQIDWPKVYLFWSDERSVPPDHPESNYHMAMKAGFSEMPIPPEHIHRMHAETDIEKNALAYEKIIQKSLKGRPFDLIMLGMGEDGHTASLFPHTEGLKATGRLVIPNYIKKLDAMRMTFTYDCINHANHIAIYVLGASKQDILAKVLKGHHQPDEYPIQKVGTPAHKALWIADQDAASELVE